jgi:sugar transferase (PEP-CTERM system associated)
VNHVFHQVLRRGALRQVAFDILAVLATVGLGVLWFVDRPQLMLPAAGAQAVSLAAGLFVINSASGFYEGTRRRNWLESLARALFALLLALPLTYAVFSFYPAELPQRQTIQWLAVASVAAVVLRRVYVAHYTDVPGARLRVLVFGAGDVAAKVDAQLSAADPNLHIVGFVPGPNETTHAVPGSRVLNKSGCLSELARRLQVDEIVVALTERRAGSMPLRELLECKVSGFKVYDVSTHFEKTMGQIPVDHVNASWLVFGDGFNQSGWRSGAKRGFDVLVALVLLLITAPVMLLAALAVRLESRGPVFYRQERVGLDGTSVNVIKFRSMCSDAESDGKPRWAVANDDRITRVGRFMRKTRVDELPQLFNVLSGEMSMVGPRPERPYFVEQLTQQIPFFAVRHSVKPGVTGWAQVRAPYGASVEDAKLKLQYDLYYVKNHSLLLDMLILLETVGVVVTGKGAR